MIESFKHVPRWISANDMLTTLSIGNLSSSHFSSQTVGRGTSRSKQSASRLCSFYPRQLSIISAAVLDRLFLDRLLGRLCSSARNGLMQRCWLVIFAERVPRVHDNCAEALARQVSLGRICTVKNQLVDSQSNSFLTNKSTQFFTVLASWWVKNP